MNNLTRIKGKKKNKSIGKRKCFPKQEENILKSIEDMLPNVIDYIDHRSIEIFKIKGKYKTPSEIGSLQVQFIITAIELFFKEYMEELGISVTKIMKYFQFDINDGAQMKPELSNEIRDEKIESLLEELCNWVYIYNGMVMNNIPSLDKRISAVSYNRYEYIKNVCILMERIVSNRN